MPKDGTTATAPSESDLASKIDKSGLLGQNGEPKAARAAAPDRDLRRAPAPRQQQREEPEEPETDDTTEPEDAEEIPYDPGEDADEGTDAQDAEDEEGGTDRSPSANREIQRLREELAELRGAVSGSGRKDASATGEPEGSAGPKGEPDKQKKRFERFRAKVLDKARKEKWGDIAEDHGLTDLLEDLDEFEKEVDAKLGKATSAIEQRAKAEKEAAERAQMLAANRVHDTLTALARSSPTLTQALGTRGADQLTPRQRTLRSEILDEAIAQHQKSARLVKLGRRTAPYTEQQALRAAVKELLGEDAATADPQAQARDRARMVRPAGGASTARPPAKETAEQTENRLAKAADEFFAKHQ